MTAGTLEYKVQQSFQQCLIIDGCRGAGKTTLLNLIFPPGSENPDDKGTFGPRAVRCREPEAGSLEIVRLWAYEMPRDGAMRERTVGWEPRRGPSPPGPPSRTLLRSRNTASGGASSLATGHARCYRDTDRPMGCRVAALVVPWPTRG